ncbi:Hypothetical predicted protein [Paramuricea clavata]|uniref:Uncharacterized protein n=1 Tax=Paramuricea clavata TaxID=317549 RepID=A0A6S7JIW0_PARCT|nr:Hypothetical predicted protein [Paramuricea clavata]
MLATGRVSESSVNLSQNLAESLLDFVDDDSSSIWKTTNTKQTEPILLENSKDLCSNNNNNNDFEVEHSLIQCDGSQLLEHLQLNGLLWKGSPKMLKNLMSELLQEQSKWCSPGGGAMQFNNCSVLVVSQMLEESSFTKSSKDSARFWLRFGGTDTSCLQHYAWSHYL